MEDNFWYCKILILYYARKNIRFQMLNSRRMMNRVMLLRKDFCVTNTIAESAGGAGQITVIAKRRSV